MTSTAADIIIPDDLIELTQFVPWKRENSTKVPYTVRGRRASTTRPTDWSDFEDVAEVIDNNPGVYAGLGFVFSDQDPYCGIDLDDTIENGATKCPVARSIVERFGDCYQEISPSGHGVKIWTRGVLPGPIGKRLIRDGTHVFGIEIYDRKRFFTVTGRRFNNSPLEIEDHTADLVMLYKWLTQSRRQRWQQEPNPDGRIPYGRQHLCLVSLAGTLRARGVCDDAILECLKIVNQRQCEKPGPVENIRRIVESSRPWSQPA